MYNHSAVKLNGKNNAKSNSNAIVVSLLLLILGGNGAGGGNYYNFGNSFSNHNTSSTVYGDGASDVFSKLGSEFSGPLTAVVVGVIIVAFLLSISFSLFVSMPVQVGGAGWFRRSVNAENPTIGSLFSTFKSGHYLTTIGTMFMYNLYIFLWSLLCLIPGIIKGYSYMMVPYIKSENPNLSADECINMSRQMTDGHKADLFYLDLSFIGWFILSICTCCILGILYVYPYYNSTKACAYEALKAEAINSGKLSPEQFKPADGGYYATTGY